MSDSKTEETAPRKSGGRKGFVLLIAFVVVGVLLWSTCHHRVTTEEFCDAVHTAHDYSNDLDVSAEATLDAEAHVADLAESYAISANAYKTLSRDAVTYYGHSSRGNVLALVNEDLPRLEADCEFLGR